MKAKEIEEKVSYQNLCTTSAGTVFVPTAHHWCYNLRESQYPGAQSAFWAACSNTIFYEQQRCSKGEIKRVLREPLMLSLISAAVHLLTDLKEFKIHTAQLVGSSLSPRLQVWAPACHLAITPKDYFTRQSKALSLWLQSQRPSSLGSTHAQLRLVGQASTSTGCFLVSAVTAESNPLAL